VIYETVINDLFQFKNIFVVNTQTLKKVSFKVKEKSKNYKMMEMIDLELLYRLF
jgi:hypothetical protein